MTGWWDIQSTSDSESSQKVTMINNIWLSANVFQLKNCRLVTDWQFHKVISLISEVNVNTQVRRSCGRIFFLFLVESYSSFSTNSSTFSLINWNKTAYWTEIMGRARQFQSISHKILSSHRILVTRSSKNRLRWTISADFGVFGDL